MRRRESVVSRGNSLTGLLAYFAMSEFNGVLFKIDGSAIKLLAGGAWRGDSEGISIRRDRPIDVCLPTEPHGFASLVRQSFQRSTKPGGTASSARLYRL